MSGSHRVICPDCYQVTEPVAYFSRGSSIAKLLLLGIPFNFIGPAIFFFLRKDRLVCSLCHRILPFEVALGMLDAFSGRPRALLPGMAAYDGQALALAPEGSPELLDSRGRIERRRAWGAGVMAAGWAGLGVLAAGGGETTAVFFTVSGVCGVGAGWSAWRSRSLGRLAESSRRRRRRAQILDLARTYEGRLNVTLVASALGVDFDEAEKSLDALVDGRRVDMHVDDEGRITYVFPELAR